MYLEYSKRALALQSAGLEASLAGRQDNARQQYLAALSFLPYDGFADSLAQRGAIMRDYGFTYTREGTANASVTHFEEARSQLGKAVAETAPVAAGAVLPDFRKPGPHNTYKKPRRQLLSEHAASLALVARNATAQAVTTGETAVVSKELQAYGWAHDMARQGTNGYYRINNAMAGARDERRRGNKRLPHTAVWLARAAFGMVWSVKNDRKSLLPGLRSIAARSWDLRTAGTASRSVVKRP